MFAGNIKVLSGRMWPAGRTLPDVGKKLCTLLCFSSYLVESGKKVKEKECNFILMKKLFDKNCQKYRNLDVGGVCGAGEVCVDLLLVLTLVQVLKFHLDVCRTVVIVVRTFTENQTIINKFSKLMICGNFTSIRTIRPNGQST